MKIIQGLCGYDFDDVNWEDMKIIAEIKTGGEDSDGYMSKETFGVAKFIGDDALVLYRGFTTTDAQQVQTVCLSDHITTDTFPDLLRRLASELESKGMVRDEE